MEAIAKLSEEASKGGTMLEAGGLAPTAMSHRVRLAKGKITVIDGPFAETKEVIGGYAVFEVKSKQEMIDATVQFMELHREHWPGWEGPQRLHPLVLGATARVKGGLLLPGEEIRSQAKGAIDAFGPGLSTAKRLRNKAQRGVLGFIT
jgi:hypothetical protein